MLAGFLINHFKTPPRMPIIFNLLFWAISSALMFLMVFGVWNGSLSVIWTAIYVSLGHTGEYEIYVPKGCE